MNNKEIQALINLLDDPDEKIFSQVKSRILTYGNDVIPLLESAWEHSFDGLLQERIENLIHHIQFSNIKIGLREWALSGGKDLLSGVLFIAHYQYPDIDESVIKNFINKLSQEIWLEINPNLTALEQIKVVNRIFYETHGFTGNRTNFSSPKNSFINNVIESKRGNPLSLAILYIIICNKIDIPVMGVNLPGHFVMAYVNELKFLFDEKISQKDILFYINPFTKGYVFSADEVKRFVKQLRTQKEHDAYFLPCKNVTIVARMINNLIVSYDKLGYPDKKEEMILLREAVNV